MRFLCKIGIHKYKDIKTQITKGVGFGFAGCEAPGMRLVKECLCCNKIDYMNLNMSMPSKYLYDESIWAKDI